MKKLVKTPRTYFDSGCHEYSTYPIESKLLDIGYVTWYGHDIMEDIRYIKENYAHVSKRDIQISLWAMMAYVNDLESSVIKNFDRGNTIETDVEILLEDLMRRFRLPEGKRSKAYLADDFNTMALYELASMNGWETATGDNITTSMYAYNGWVMFPGDGEIIRNFNIHHATPDCCYPSYVYPEPWYGSPLNANVVILGNETHYDDFISRVQNIIMDERRTELIRSIVDSWLGLHNQPIFADYSKTIDPTYIAPMDPYNSPSYRFWLTEIRAIARKLHIEQDNSLFEKIAVLNANPYPSVGAPPLSAGMLPSHYFLRQLVRYIVYSNPDVKFILPSETLHSVWRTILGDVYTTIWAFGKIIQIHEGRSNSISRHITRPQLSILRPLLS